MAHLPHPRHRRLHHHARPPAARAKGSALRRLLALLGPGFITGVSDDDPSGIATYSQTGAQFGYRQLWTPLTCLPFMVMIQETCGRIGMVTGHGLAGILRRHYPKSILSAAVLLLLIANTINIGADLGAMAATLQSLTGIPFAAGLIGMTLVTLLLEVFVSYRLYSRYLKYLAFSVFAYIVAAFLLRHDGAAVGRAILIPQIVWSREYAMNLVAVLGTTISPYLFFWQASEEVEREVESHKLDPLSGEPPRITPADIRDMRWDTAIGMFFAVAVMFSIILVTAETLGKAGITRIETADQAALALRPLAGDFAYLLFSLGILGTGLLAVPVLAGSASYAFSEAFGWRPGLYLKLKQAHGFYGVITVATLAGILINFSGIPPFAMLYYSAVVNGLAAPPLMVLILLIANRRDVMGSYTNPRWVNLGSGLITALMTLAGLALLAATLFRR